MNEIIRIEKEFLFKNTIKDITSISIDCKYKNNENGVIGDFIVSGEYKIHEISLNKEKFNYKIPFSFNIENDIDKDSVKVDIINFLYDYNKDELMVNIEYIVTGDRKDILSFEDDESLEEFLNSREVEIVDTRADVLEKEENIQSNENIILVEDKIKEEKEVSKESIIGVKIEENEKIDKDKILSGVSNIEDKYVSYKVYTIKETDTLENLVIKHNTTLDFLKEYNDFSVLNINDKIIIPNE